MWSCTRVGCQVAGQSRAVARCGARGDVVTWLCERAPLCAPLWVAVRVCPPRVYWFVVGQRMSMSLLVMRKCGGWPSPGPSRQRPLLRMFRRARGVCARGPTQCHSRQHTHHLPLCRPRAPPPRDIHTEVVTQPRGTHLTTTRTEHTLRRPQRAIPPRAACRHAGPPPSQTHTHQPSRNSNRHTENTATHAHTHPHTNRHESAESAHITTH